MSRPLFFAGLVIMAAAACDTKLSKEQQKAFREEMERREIKKIRPEAIYEKALAEGRLVAGELPPSGNVDSVKKACGCDMIFASDTAGLTEKEKAVFQAYQYNPRTDGDNVQKDGDATLIYAKPEVAGDTLRGVWFIRFEKSAIVRKL